MCGCCSRAVTRISCLKRSKLTPAARSGDSTLTTTRRPSASSSARNTRLMPPPPSSRSRRYASLRVACSRSRRSVSKPATFATSEADSKAALEHARQRRGGPNPRTLRSGRRGVAFDDDDMEGLRSSEQEAQEIVDASPQTIAVLSPDGQALYVYPHAQANAELVAAASAKLDRT